MVNLNVTLEEGLEGNYIYFVGHRLKGTVEMSSGQLFTARGLYVEVVGKARSHWSTRSSNSSSNHKEKVYLKSRTYLFGDYNGQIREFPAGVNSYNFSFKLPSKLPDPFQIPPEGIEHYVKVGLDIPMAFDEEVKIPITIISPNDLNLHPKGPRNFEYLDGFRSSSESYEPFKMVFSMTLTGFFPGQEVPYTIKYTNGSNVEVKKTKMKLKREIIYKRASNSDTKVEYKEFELAVLKGVKAQTNEIITGTITVPQVLPRNDGFSKVLLISYCLGIRGEVSGFYTTPRISIPITAGTIEIKGNIQPFVDQHAPTAPIDPMNSGLYTASKVSAPIPAGTVEVKGKIQPDAEQYTPTAPMDPFGPIAPSAPPNDEEDLPPPFEVAIHMLKFQNPTGKNVPENF